MISFGSFIMVTSKNGLAQARVRYISRMGLCFNQVLGVGATHPVSAGLPSSQLGSAPSVINRSDLVQQISQGLSFHLLCCRPKKSPSLSFHVDRLHISEL
jgi:hypothetical protein